MIFLRKIQTELYRFFFTYPFVSFRSLKMRYRPCLIQLGSSCGMEKIPCQKKVIDIWAKKVVGAYLSGNPKKAKPISS